MNEAEIFLRQLLDTQDASWLIEKKKWVRSLDDDEKMILIHRIFEYNTQLGLSFAHSCIARKQDLIDLLEFGLLNKDASEIKHWITKLADRLSMADIKKILLHIHQENIGAFNNAVYWFNNIQLNNIDSGKIQEYIHELYNI